MEFLFFLALIASLAVSFVIAVPLAGALVRFRANYTPKVSALRLRSKMSTDIWRGMTGSATGWRGWCATPHGACCQVVLCHACKSQALGGKRSLSCLIPSILLR